jgi:Tfp pilus assembly protein PilF
MLNSNSVKPSLGIYVNQSLEYFKEGNYEDCVSACRKSLEIDSSSAIVWNNMCSAYNALGKYDEAEKACEHAVKLDSNFALAKTNLNIAKQGKKK